MSIQQHNVRESVDKNGVKRKAHTSHHHVGENIDLAAAGGAVNRQKPEGWTGLPQPVDIPHDQPSEPANIDYAKLDRVQRIEALRSGEWLPETDEQWANLVPDLMTASISEQAGIEEGTDKMLYFSFRLDKDTRPRFDADYRTNHDEINRDDRWFEIETGGLAESQQQAYFDEVRADIAKLRFGGDVLADEELDAARAHLEDATPADGYCPTREEEREAEDAYDAGIPALESLVAELSEVLPDGYRIEFEEWTGDFGGHVQVFDDEGDEQADVQLDWYAVMDQNFDEVRRAAGVID